MPSPEPEPATEAEPVPQADPADAARRRLGRVQADLLAALVAGRQPAEGFDPARLAIQAAALLAKRRDGVARVAPETVVALGADFPALFAAYAHDHPRPAAGARADAAAFRAHLRQRGLLTRRAPRARRFVARLTGRA